MVKHYPNIPYYMMLFGGIFMFIPFFIYIVKEMGNEAYFLLGGFAIIIIGVIMNIEEGC